MTELLTELITAYMLIGFAPWFAWCVSEVWYDYGRRISTMRKRNSIFIMIVWIIWPLAIRTTRDNFSSERFNRNYDYYR